MDTYDDRRSEQRLPLSWPVRLNTDTERRDLPGQMVDVSSHGAGLFCQANETCPRRGQQVTAKFKVPHFGPGSSVELKDFTRTGRVCRVDEVDNFLRRVAIQFAEPLSFKPGEQNISESDAEQRINAVPKDSLLV